MNAKTKYAIPALAAAVALMFAAVTPYVMADQDSEKAWKYGAKHHKHTIQVDGFVGSIPITKDTDKASLKEQITVSLSEAAEGLDVYKGKIGIAANENGDKFLVWKLISMEKSEDSTGMTITVHVVDAGNVENRAQMVKEFDLSAKEKVRGESKGL